MEKDPRSSPNSVSNSPAAFTPRLLIEPEAGRRVFLGNLLHEFFHHRAVRSPHSTEWPAFWSDVFVPSGLPWWRFVESFALHVLVIAGLWSASRAWLLRPQVLPPPVFSQRDVIYFPASEYLPPLDTGTKTPRPEQKGEPEFSKQDMLSVPPEADNRTQTVVTPPEIKLKNDIPLPNVVAWKSVTPAAPITALSGLQLPAQQPTTIIAPPPRIEEAVDRRYIEVAADAVVAPPPQVTVATSVHVLVTPQAVIIEPPPTIQGNIRRAGEINIGHSEIVPPAPQLPISEQRSLAYRASAESGNLARGVVPPPPSVRGRAVFGWGPPAGGRPSTEIVPPPPAIPGSDRSSNRIVALGLHPVAGAPPLASGNRRGTFALSPKGKPGAPGTPDLDANNSADNARSGKGGAGVRSDLPPGLVVKPRLDSPQTTADKSRSASATLMAEAKPPLRVGPVPRRAMASTSEPTAEEREVFGNRKFYSMVLNMPNLNSAGGSWIIRFAELKNGVEQGDLMAPEATRKVDPAYPLELMRTQIEGRVTLYAVIRSDGTVGDVRVLSSVDARLDEYARAALSRWRFRPATKAGNAIDLEAVVTIPFRARPAF